MAKKKGGRASVPVKSFMKPEWRQRIYGEGGPKEPPPRTAKEAALRREQTRITALPAWLRPFESMRPSPEEAAAREERRLKKKPLVDVLVPREELEYIQRMRERSRAQAPGRGPGMAPPLVGPQSRRYGPPPPAARTYGGGPQPRGESPISAFDLPALWEGLRRVRSDPRFKGTYGVGLLSQGGRTQAERAVDVAGFFKVPGEVLRRYRPETLWLEWAEPLLKSVEDELNQLKPRDIPGRLRFDLARDGAFGLVYVE